MRRGLWVLLAAVTLAVPAFAQRVEHGSTTLGRGTFRTPNVNMTFEETTVVIDADGTVQVGLVGNQKITLVGTWSRHTGNVYEVELKGGTGAPDGMKGTIAVTNTYVSRMDIRGGDRSSHVLTFIGSRVAQPGQGGGTTNPGGGGNNPNPGDFRMALKTTPRGSGDFRYASENAGISRVTVDIRNDGRVFIEFAGSRVWTLVGRYDRMRGNVLPVTMYDGLGARDVSGSGTIMLSNDRRTVTRVSLSGIADRSSYRLNFTPGRFGIDQSVIGTGTFTMSGRRDDTGRVRVILNPNGRFTIRIEDRARTEYQGNWTEQNNGQIDLRIDALLPEASNAFGNGTLRLDNRDQVTQINLSGNSNQGRFDLNYRRR